MNLQKAYNEYTEHGVAVIPEVFTPEECNKIRGSALVALSSQNGHYNHKYIEFKNEHFPALVFWPSLVNGYLNEVRADARLAEIVQFFLGDDVKQLNNQIYFRMPGDGDEFAWHQDVCFREPKNRYPGIEDSYLQTIIAIDDIDLTNSPVEFIPGSHKHGVQDIHSNEGVTKMLRTFKRSGLKGEKYTVNQGDVMVWSVLTVHGSERNESRRMRMTYMNGFAKANAALDWPMYIQNGKVITYPDYKLIP